MVVIRLLLVCLAAQALSACAGAPREARSPDQLQADKARFFAGLDAHADASFDKVVRRMEMIRAGKTGDDSYDVLLLSGGGDWGVFGAAYLNGWLENTALPMPEFDYVAGISTGSLIAAYTASGDAARYREMEQFYLHADNSFVDPGSAATFGVRFIRNDPSLLDTTLVEQAVGAAIDDRLIDELAAAGRAEKIVAAGAVNLDLGALKAFDLTEEVGAAAAPDARVKTILLASSAVPAAFPPVEIDGHLYVDGGASVGVPIFRAGAIDEIMRHWARRSGGKPPKIRIWVIFNNKLSVRPTVTDLGWADVLLRSYKVALQTTLVAPLVALNESIRPRRAGAAPRAELRWVAIPDSFDEGAANSVFAPEMMRQLSMLGRSMGRNPDSWRRRPPRF